MRAKSARAELRFLIVKEGKWYFPDHSHANNRETAACLAGLQNDFSPTRRAPLSCRKRQATENLNVDAEGRQHTHENKKQSGGRGE